MTDFCSLVQLCESAFSDNNASLYDYNAVAEVLGGVEHVCANEYRALLLF